jgi:hypothetical protein
MIVKHKAKRISDGKEIQGWLLQSSKYANRPERYFITTEGNCTNYLGLEFTEVDYETIKIVKSKEK